jgi:hypothetical protein
MSPISESRGHFAAAIGAGFELHDEHRTPNLGARRRVAVAAHDPRGDHTWPC